MYKLLDSHGILLAPHCDYALLLYMQFFPRCSVYATVNNIPHLEATVENNGLKSQEGRGVCWYKAQAFTNLL